MSIKDKCLLVNLVINRYQGQRKDAVVTEDVNNRKRAESTAGHYSKQTFSKNSLKRINNTVSQARLYHTHQTKPWLDGDRRIIPTKRFLTYREEMSKLQAEFFREVDNFARNLDTIIDMERNRLGDLFNIDDYPSADELRSRFTFDIYVEPVATQDDFRAELSDEEAARIRQMIELNAASAEEKLRQGLYEDIYKLVSKIIPSLSDPDKRIYDSYFNNIKGLVTSLAEFNVTNDPKLTELRNRISTEILKFAPDTLREDLVHRKETATAAKSIIDDMAAFMGQQ